MEGPGGGASVPISQEDADEGKSGRRKLRATLLTAV